jgi:hypothetical protein
MITSVKNYGRCGITGVYVGFVSTINRGLRVKLTPFNNLD